MHFWRQNPFLRLVIPLASGIAVALWLRRDLPWMPQAAAASAAAYTVFLLLPLRYSWRWLPGALASLTLFLCGYSLLLSRSHWFDPDNIAHAAPAGSRLAFCAEVTEPPAAREKTVKVTARVLALAGDGLWRPVSGRILIYVRSDSAAADIAYGDRLLVHAYINPVESFTDEFDYRAWLWRRNIFVSAYAGPGQWKVLERGAGSGTMGAVFRLRAAVQQRLRTAGLDDQGFGVASALLLGTKDDMDRELKEAYSKAGVMHVLAVSGLHTGIVFIAVSYALFFLGRLPGGQVIRAAAVILSLWMYALLTGLSPSVCRAATMFSFVAAGLALGRHSSVYNTLASSAFFLLLINPFLLADAGFQLSYLAVAGIVAMQPHLYRQVAFGNFFLDKAWAIATVSLAAQIATFPLTLYYFGQFSNYFLVANLLVIPLVGFALYAGLAFLAVASLPYLSVLAAWALQLIITALNTCVGVIDALPAAAAAVSISSAEMLLLYGSIAFFVAWCLLYRIRHLQTGLALLIAALAVRIALCHGLPEYLCDLYPNIACFA